MKIVRLTSDEQTAMFDNTFNDDITIGAKSRVALHSVTTETAPRVIDLNASNNTITIQVQNGQVFNPVIKSGIYNKANNSVLFKDIGDKINESLMGKKDPASSTSFPTGAQMGMMFKCDIGTDKVMGETGKVFVGYKTLNEANMSTDDTKGTWFSSLVTEAPSGNTKSYKRTSGGGDDGAESYLHSQTPITQGCGQISAKALTLDPFVSEANPFESGFFIGLTDIKPTKGAILSYADCLFGVQCPGGGTGGEPNIVTGDDATPVEQEFAVGERLGLERYEGKWVAVKYTTANVRVPFTVDGATDAAEMPYNYSEGFDDLYAVVIFAGSGTDTVIDTVRWTPDPYLYATPPTSHLGVGPTNPNLSTQGFLEMANSLSNFLGFNASRTPVIGTKTLTPKQFTFNATNLLKDALNAESFYVELLSLSLDCYDGLTNGRKSILAVIPVSDSDQKILYEPDFPVFIDINNQYETSLRTIRARLLNQDGSPVLTEGVSVLTLLFD